MAACHVGSSQKKIAAGLSDLSFSFQSFWSMADQEVSSGWGLLNMASIIGWFVVGCWIVSGFDADLCCYVWCVHTPGTDCW